MEAFRTMVCAYDAEPYGVIIKGFHRQSGPNVVVFVLTNVR